MTLLALGKYTGHLENIQGGCFPFPSSSYLCWSVVIWGYQRRCVAMIWLWLQQWCCWWRWCWWPSVPIGHESRCQGVGNWGCHFRPRDLIHRSEVNNKAEHDDPDGEEKVMMMMRLGQNSFAQPPFWQPSDLDIGFSWYQTFVFWFVVDSFSCIRPSRFPEV